MTDATPSATEATTPAPERVPGRAHYGWTYVGGARAFSYAHQLDTLVALQPESVVEIGPGPGVVTAAMRAIGVDVTTVDVQAELNPDVVASVLDLPFEDDAFDVSMCCQVLEHIPFDDFERAAKELRRVARKGMVISLPDCSSHYEISTRLPKVGWRSRSISRRRPPSEKYKASALEKAGHHWEIGYPETPLSRVLDSLAAAGLNVHSTWRVRELPYHRFFRIS